MEYQILIRDEKNNQWFDPSYVIYSHYNAAQSVFLRAASLSGVWGEIKITNETNEYDIILFIRKNKAVAPRPRYETAPLIGGENRYFYFFSEHFKQEIFKEFSTMFKTEQEDSHKGMVYNPYNDTWGWGF